MTKPANIPTPHKMLPVFYIYEYLSLFEIFASLYLKSTDVQ